MSKWYLNTWFIAILFGLWFLIVPPIIAIYFMVLQYKEFKTIKDKANSVTNVENYRQEIENICRYKEQETSRKCQDRETLSEDKCKNKERELENIKSELRKAKSELTDIKNEIFEEYIYPYSSDDNITSEEYKNKLSVLRAEISNMIKNDKYLKIAANASDKKKVLNNNIKQMLRCFNSESQYIIDNVTVKNIDTSRNKLQKAFETINKIFETDGVALDLDFLNKKLEEMHLVYSYQLKKEQEKEEQKAIREQMVEEEKARREIEREKAKIEKEESQFKGEIEKLMKYLQKASDIEKQLYVDKIKELEEKLKGLEKDKENMLQREQNTRAGFVYVISNIGSFGEDVYKIGMTRRLEPMDRINELGSASVPFEFDVHAMIFSEDAPNLETVLHQTFKKYQVNKVNNRKEFFKVSLDEIEKTVKQNHNATVTFTKIAEAAQYRESLRLAESGT